MTKMGPKHCRDARGGIAPTNKCMGPKKVRQSSWHESITQSRRACKVGFWPSLNLAYPNLTMHYPLQESDYRGTALITALPPFMTTLNSRFLPLCFDFSAGICRRKLFARVSRVIPETFSLQRFFAVTSAR